MFFINLCFGFERMPKYINYIANSYDGKIKITYMFNKLEKKDINDIEREILSVLENNKSYKFNNITLAKYTSKDHIGGGQVTPDLAPVDVICVDYENDWFIRDIRRELSEALLKSSIIHKFSEHELTSRIKGLNEYDIEFLCSDRMGTGKGSEEIAFLVKDNSLIIFYYRCGWLEPIKQLVKQINASNGVRRDQKK